MGNELWPHTKDPYRAAWADVFRYVHGNDALIDAIAAKHDLDPVPRWDESDPVDQRLRKARTR